MAGHALADKSIEWNSHIEKGGSLPAALFIHNIVMTFAEDDLIPISALQHFAFCVRQCALIHIERIWQDNKLTAEGQILHEHVHRKSTETRENVHIACSLRLRSLRLGLAGIADVVEFSLNPRGIKVPGLPGHWILRPVEYKRGRPKPDRCDEIQVCAQAICLEEMLNTVIEEGDIFYGQPRRRHKVRFDVSLRKETEAVAMRIHALFRAGLTPPANISPKCRSCSLNDQCLPKTAGAGKSARRYVGQMLTP